MKKLALSIAEFDRNRDGMLDFKEAVLGALSSRDGRGLRDSWVCSTVNCDLWRFLTKQGLNYFFLGGFKKALWGFSVEEPKHHSGPFSGRFGSDWSARL